MSAVSMRVVVLRGERYDVVNWEPGEPGWFDRQGEPPSSNAWVFAFAVAASILVLAGTFFLVRAARPKTLEKPLVATIADLSAVHAKVTVSGEEARGLRRLTPGDAMETDADGRARIRLDDGTTVVVDRSTKLALKQNGFALQAGRVFVQGALGARSEIEVGGASAIVSGATAAIDAGKSGEAKAKIYVASGELTVTREAAETTVRAGDTATIEANKVSVAPERGFDDWTFGMAAPWGASGPPRRAVGELWGRPTSAATSGSHAFETGSPLTVRAHDVAARIAREVAVTEARTEFFNAGSETVLGDYRMAVPKDAIVTRFATVRGETVSEGRIALAARKQSGPTASGEALEWAGEGWVRATVPNIAAGQTVSVVVEYVEWLSPRARPGSKNLVVAYRYPMVGDGQPPLVGEFSARIDASPSNPRSIAAGLAAQVVGQSVVVHRNDFRPSADLVVDVEIEPFAEPARAYFAPPLDLSDDAGTIVVRAEAPSAAADDGVSLALVLDASASIEPALFDAEKSLALAVLEGLGAHDRIAVIAADQTPRAVGPKTAGFADAARKKLIAEALDRETTGGATDLGRALEAGADALPSDAAAGMVVYVGDGWATVGDATVDAILARLARRPHGSPRLGAVAVGPLVNRFALAGLVRGSGPLFEIADSSDAAKTAIALLGDALKPTVADVSLVFGPEVDRIYPRTPRAVVAGETVTAVGRLRGEAPKSVTLRYRDDKGAHEKVEKLVAVEGARELDVSRRWAAARVEDIALSGKGREAATDVALRAKLLTPWTGFLIGGGDTYVPTLLGTRVLDLAIGPDAGFSAALATPPSYRGTLATASLEENDDGGDDEAGYKASISRAAARAIREALPQVRACRDSRAALRPELEGDLAVALDLDGDGRASDVSVRGGKKESDDAALDRCVEVIVEGLAFPASGLKVKVRVVESVGLPRVRTTLRARKCSPTSSLPTALRRGVWLERLRRSPAAPAVTATYLDAKDACELTTWTDKRALLELVLGLDDGPGYRVQVARELARAGEDDAAGLVRRETVRRARSPEELAVIQRELVGDENFPRGVFKKQYEAAKDDSERLAVVRRFLAIAPHDARLYRRLFALLEARGMKPELAEEVRRLRKDPFVDAGLLADGASALVRMGDEAEGRRAFGELAERAPEDAWARAFLGDRLRNEGWFDDATRAYAVLEGLLPDDPAALLRLALAHAGAGRIDIAGRMLARVAATGGRTADAALGELAARTALDILTEARARAGATPEETDALARASLELPQKLGATVFLLRAPAASRRIESLLVRGPKDAREERAPDVASPAIGLYSHRLDAGDDVDVVLRLRRGAEPPPANATKVRIDALVPGKGREPPRLVTTEVELPPSGKTVELRWTGSSFTSG